MTHARPDATPGRDKLASSDAFRDPAKGEKVPRCAICGMPERTHAPLLPGFWRYAARPGMDLTLCEPCVMERSQRYNPDQITLLEIA